MFTHLISGDLAKSELFRRKSYLLPWEDRVRLSYERARALTHAYDLTTEDILHVSSKFWELQTDPILTMDDSLTIILTTQLTLCAGALATFADRIPHLEATLQAFINFEIFGVFCLTERDRGPNSSNVGTCAVMHPDGSFDLWTPYDGAAKLLPPFFPSGIPSKAIVFARLVVGGGDRGIKPFLVPLHEGGSMSPGITIKPRSTRSVTNPSDPAFAYFNHVYLPPTALLTSQTRTSGSQENYLRLVSRAVTRSLALTAACLPIMRVMSHVVGKCSSGKATADPLTGLQRRAIGLSTQYIPVMTAIAHTFISAAFADSVRAALHSPEYKEDIKHSMVAVLKSVVFDHTTTELELLERQCGAQALVVPNKLNTLLAGVRALRATDGDTPEASARLAIDLVLGKVAVPPPTDPASPLAQHETFLTSELKGLLPHDVELHGDRGFGFLMTVQTEVFILPLCVSLVLAVGHRMAHDAAVKASIDPVLVDIYLASAILSDPAWYSEARDPAIRLSGFDQVKRQVEACSRGVERIEEWLEKLGVEPYVPVTIASDKQWDDCVETFEVFGEADGFEDEYEEFTFGDTGDLVDGLDIDTVMTGPTHSISPSRF